MAVFKEKTDLAHYIHRLQRMTTGYPSETAFVEPEPPAEKKKDKHLSVNSLAIEKMEIIADYYRTALQRDADKVAVTVHKVSEYNSNGKKVGALIKFNRKTSTFEFAGSADYEPAYKHRPVPPLPQRTGSESHCGVEFVRAFDELAERKFSRRMARKRFHLR